MNKFITLCLAAVMPAAVSAQKCMTSQKVKESIAAHPEMAQKVAELEAFTQQWIANNRAVKKTTATTRVPVVVHVLYKDAGENVSDAQIQSEFPVLNAAYSKTNANFSNTPAAFQALAGNPDMEFCLASKDLNGNAFSGINRVSVSSSFNGETDYFDPNKGGVAPWDPDKYVNVYLVGLTNGNLGFTYTPGTAPAGEEGIVIDSRAWGNTGTASSNQPNDKGATACHEFGHYFNLLHIWGTSASGCSDDDGVADTPPQDGESSGCPTYPLMDNCTATGDGIMFMNFMDYADDACMTMFSAGQVQRMQAAIAGPRAALVTSTVCGSVSVSTITQTTARIYPNPANDRVHIRLNRPAELNVQLVNSIGMVVLQQQISAAEVTLNTSALPAGWYFVRANGSEVNATAKIYIAH
ncbi:MAG: T9SS type A sorting domain-containing protein [Chitinophagaceae bacterium]|nr:T9SS type A sorting domain-containing protein [Chitinophagaceae bacterium]MCB9046817.1 T9SS type A sorting domain-containing protein [Chitinophagales bacterium]